MRQVMKRNVLFLLFAIKLRMNNAIFVDTYLGAKEWGYKINVKGSFTKCIILLFYKKK